MSAVLVAALVALWHLLPAQHLLDESNTEIVFTVQHFGFATSGSFSRMKGTAQFDVNDPAGCNFNVSVDAATINTSIDLRDTNLRGEKYFDVKHFPNIVFSSTRIEKTAIEKKWIVIGDLTLKGIKKTVSIPTEVVINPDGTILLTGMCELKRSDFDVGPSGLIGDEVHAKLKVTLKKKDDEGH